MHVYPGSRQTSYWWSLWFKRDFLLPSKGWNLQGCGAWPQRWPWHCSLWWLPHRSFLFLPQQSTLCFVQSWPQEDGNLWSVLTVNLICSWGGTLFRPYISSLVYISGTDIHTIMNAHLQNPWQLLQPCIRDQNNFESLAREATAISPCSLQLDLAPQGFRGMSLCSWGT